MATSQQHRAASAPAPNDEPIHAVIMAGGQGQRFWPLSTPERPKQFLDLGRNGHTLIQSTYDRVLPLAHTPERVFVATAERYLDLVHEQLPDVPPENILVEPTPRDSAPAIALACLSIHQRFGDVVTGFFSSDHQIGPGFASAILSAAQVARERHGLVTVGITPSRPSTGYGYIELGDPEGDAFRVSRFVEKPNARSAEAYLSAGNYLWNAGIFNDKNLCGTTGDCRCNSGVFVIYHKGHPVKWAERFFYKKFRRFFVEHMQGNATVSRKHQGVTIKRDPVSFAIIEVVAVVVF